MILAELQIYWRPEHVDASKGITESQQAAWINSAGAGSSPPGVPEVPIGTYKLRGSTNKVDSAPPM